MKRELIILGIFCALMLGSITSCIAEEDYGLHWGFEVGDQFHFRYSGTPFIPIIDYYVEIQSIPFNFTDDIDLEDGLEYTNFDYCSFHYENGTEMTYPMIWFALPVGNWSFIQEGMNDTLPYSPFDSFEWIDTEVEWGFIFAYNISSIVMTSTLRISKIDGVLNLLRSVLDPGTGPTVTFQTERKVPQSLSLLSLEVGIGLGVVAVVIIAVVAVVMKCR